MADDSKKAKDEGEAPEKKSSKKILLLIVLPLVLAILGGGGFFVWSNIINKPHAEEGKKGEELKKEQGKEEKAEETGGIFPLEPFIVNLQDNVGTRYLKVSINLEIEGVTEEDVKRHMAQIRDSLIILLSSKNYSDVGSVQGKYELRDEVALRVNKILSRGKVKAVYFTDFVIQ